MAYIIHIIHITYGTLSTVHIVCDNLMCPFTDDLSFQQVMQLISVLSLSFASLRGNSHSALVHKAAKKTAAGKVTILKRKCLLHKTCFVQ